jgi:hypothetical protein
MGITVALEDPEGDAFLAEGLGKGKSAQASAQDKDVWCLECAAAHRGESVVVSNTDHNLT